MTIAHKQFQWKFGNRTVDFRVPVLQCGYERCSHEWRPRSLKKPKVCPKCKRKGWDTFHPKSKRSTVPEDFREVEESK